MDNYTKVKTFLENNNFDTEPTDPTNKFQKEIMNDINLCQMIIPTDTKWKYINLNPSPPTINPLNTQLSPICHLLALLGAHHILHVSRIRKVFNNTSQTNPLDQ
jgi:hypothetical protein